MAVRSILDHFLLCSRTCHWVVQGLRPPTKVTTAQIHSSATALSLNLRRTASHLMMAVTVLLSGQLPRFQDSLARRVMLDISHPYVTLFLKDPLVFMVSTLRHIRYRLHVWLLLYQLKMMFLPWTLSQCMGALRVLSTAVLLTMLIPGSTSSISTVPIMPIILQQQASPPTSRWHGWFSKISLGRYFRRVSHRGGVRGGTPPL